MSVPQEASPNASQRQRGKAQYLDSGGGSIATRVALLRNQMRFWIIARGRGREAVTAASAAASKPCHFSKLC